MTSTHSEMTERFDETADDFIKRLKERIETLSKDAARLSSAAGEMLDVLTIDGQGILIPDIEDSETEQRQFNQLFTEKFDELQQSNAAFRDKQ